MEGKDSYEDYLKWEKNTNSKWAKISKQIKQVHVIGFFLLFFLGQYWVSTGKIPSNYFFGSVFAFVILGLFLIYRETNEPKLIPEHIIKQIAYDALEKKRAKGIEIPFDAKIKINLVGGCIYEQDLISKTSGFIKRDVGFEIIRKGYRKKGVMGVQPYNGTILGIRWEQLGYSGKGGRDRLIIPVGVVDQFSK